MHELFLAKVSSYWALWQRTRWDWSKTKPGAEVEYLGASLVYTLFNDRFFFTIHKAPKPNLRWDKTAGTCGMHNNFPLSPSNHSLSFNSSVPISFASSDPSTVPIDYWSYITKTIYFSLSQSSTIPIYKDGYSISSTPCRGRIGRWSQPL